LNANLENDATGVEGKGVQSGNNECEEVEKEESVQPSSPKEVDKSDNHGEDTLTLTRAGVSIELESNEDDNNHLVQNLEFDERNGALAMFVIAKESDANSLTQSSKGREPSKSSPRGDLLNQAKINVVDEQVREDSEANEDEKEEVSSVLCRDEASDCYEKDQQQLDSDEHSPEELNSREHNQVIALEAGESSSNHHTPLLNSATRKSPRLQAQAALLVNADGDHEDSRWLDGHGERFKDGIEKEYVMEEVASCPGQEPCKTDQSSDHQEQEKSENSGEEFPVAMPSPKTMFEIPTAVQEEGRKCPTESGGASGVCSMAASKRSENRKRQNVKQLHLDWSEEESEAVGEKEKKDMTGQVTSLQKPEFVELDKYAQEKKGPLERSRNIADQTDPINKASEVGAKKPHETEEVVKKKARSSGLSGGSTFSCLGEARSENGPKAAGNRQNVSKKKKLLGSNSTMLQVTPSLLDAPSFDTTLPDFEEAHNTSKNPKSFSKPAAGAVSFNRENELLNEDSLADFVLPGPDREDEPAAKKSKTRGVIKNPVKPTTKANTRSSEPMVAKNIERSEQRCVDTKKRSKGKNCSTTGDKKIKTSAKEKNSSQRRGGQRKAPKRNITFMDFTNYDHLEILPRNSLDLSHSVNDTYGVGESAKKRKFFKTTIAIPDHLMKRTGDRLSVSKVDISGAPRTERCGQGVSRRRSFVDPAAIASITLPSVSETSRLRHQEPIQAAKKPRMTDASTSPDQDVVVLRVEEFNKVLQLIASGIKLATATNGKSVTQEMAEWMTKFESRIPLP